MKFKLLFILALILCFLPQPIRAQGTNPCGVVDAIDYPIDGVSLKNDDFGMYRAGFAGWHTGIDMALDRYGDPAPTAAPPHCTFTDPTVCNDNTSDPII